MFEKYIDEINPHDDLGEGVAKDDTPVEAENNLEQQESLFLQEITERKRAASSSNFHLERINPRDLNTPEDSQIWTKLRDLERGDAGAMAVNDIEDYRKFARDHFNPSRDAFVSYLADKVFHLWSKYDLLEELEEVN